MIISALWASIVFLGCAPRPDGRGYFITVLRTWPDVKLPWKSSLFRRSGAISLSLSTTSHIGGSPRWQHLWLPCWLWWRDMKRIGN